MKGRKPDENAIRRMDGGMRPTHQAQALSSTVGPLELMEPPEAVSSDPAQLECWHLVVDGNTSLHPSDLLMIVPLCGWWSVYCKCLDNLASTDGGIKTTTERDGREYQHPDMRTMKQATDIIRYYCSELGLGPLPRTRMSLIETTTQSVAAEIPSKVRASIQALMMSQGVADGGIR